MTQEDLALKMGYKSKSTINKIELGKNDIPQSKIVNFAKALDTTPSYIMGWDEEIEKDPVGTAELHFEMIDMLSNEDLREIFEDLKKMDENGVKMVKKIVRSMANEEV